MEIKVCIFYPIVYCIVELTFYIMHRSNYGYSYFVILESNKGLNQTIHSD